METTEVDRLVEELEEEREARRTAERELDRLRGCMVDGEAAILRSRFLVSMGHTLRTPLNAILGFSEVLLQTQVGSLSERQRSLIGRITDAGLRQLGLIDNLIDLARIHAGDTTLELQSVEAMQLVRRIVGEYTTTARERRVELSEIGDNPGPVQCDPDQFRRALGSLVGNAIRYTGSGGVVGVTASWCAGPAEESYSGDESCDILRIEVADTGPGIPRDDQPLLFDDFEHVDSLTTRRERRSGIGLALARRIVELHGGRIGVESSGIKGEGSRFFIEIPAHPHIRSTA